MNSDLLNISANSFEAYSYKDKSRTHEVKGLKVKNVDCLISYNKLVLLIPFYYFINWI